MKPNQLLLSVENLGRQQSGRWLWKNISFRLTEGECVGLVAPSGAGKTLLMRNLAMLDPVQEGRIFFEGKSPRDWSLPIYRTRVLYLPQKAAAFDGTVRDNLKRVFALKVYRDRTFNQNQIETWLGKLGRNADFLNLQAARLSGGEAQLLALLRALQLKPQVLLLDEPTASLDASTIKQVEGLLYDWLKQPGRACLLTSHNTEQIQRITSRQLLLPCFS
jgi:putative ABC transport system ATP-binding protein